jgi:hypothetical protein
MRVCGGPVEGAVAVVECGAGAHGGDAYPAGIAGLSRAVAGFERGVESEVGRY